MKATLESQQLDEEAFSQFLSFHLGEEEYGVELLKVQEIVRDFKPSILPNTNKQIQGMINFRGKVIPLIDVRMKLGLPSREYDSFTVTIVLEYGSKNVGLIVDKVYDIISLTEKDLQSVDDNTSELRASHLIGMGKMGDRLILLLDLDKVITFD